MLLNALRPVVRGWGMWRQSGPKMGLRGWGSKKVYFLVGGSDLILATGQNVSLQNEYKICLTVSLQKKNKQTNKQNKTTNKKTTTKMYTHIQTHTQKKNPNRVRHCLDSKIFLNSAAYQTIRFICQDNVEAPFIFKILMKRLFDLLHKVLRPSISA